MANVNIYNHDTGAEESRPEEEIGALLSAGSHTFFQGEMVKFTDPSGEIYDIPAEKAKEAAARGMKFITDDTIQREADKKLVVETKIESAKKREVEEDDNDSFGWAKAAGVGIARGLSFGTSDIAMRGMGLGEVVDDAEKDWGATTTGFEVASAAASILMGYGAAGNTIRGIGVGARMAGAKGLGKGVARVLGTAPLAGAKLSRAAVRGTSAATGKLVEKAMTKMGRKFATREEASLVRRILTRAAEVGGEAGIESAMYGFGHGFANREIWENPELAAQEVLAAATLSGVSGALEAGEVGVIFGSVLGGVGPSATTVTKKLSKGLAIWGENALLKNVTGLSSSVINDIEARNLDYPGVVKVLEKFKIGITGKGAWRNREGGGRTMFGAQKPREVLASLENAKSVSGETINRMYKELDNLAEEAGVGFIEIGKKGRGKTPGTGLLGRLHEIMETLRVEKRGFGPKAKKTKPIQSRYTAIAKAIQAQMDELNAIESGRLSLSEAWELRKKWDELRPLFKKKDGIQSVARTFNSVRKAWGGVGETSSMASAGKVGDKFRASGSVKEVEKHGAIFDKLQELEAAVINAPLNHPIKVAINKLKESNYDYSALSGLHKHTKRMADKSEAAAVSFLDGFLGRVALGGLGFFTGGPSGALAGVSSALALAYGSRYGGQHLYSAFSGGTWKRFNPVMWREATRLSGDYIDKHIELYFTHRVGAIAPPVIAISLQDSVTTGSREKFKDTRAAYIKRVEEVRGAEGSRHTSEMARVASESALEEYPNAQSAMQLSVTRAMETLHESIPKTPAIIEGSFNASDYNPGERKMKEFSEIYDIINNPLSIMERLEEGNLTRESSKAFKLAYPQLYNRIVSGMVSKIAELKAEGKVIPYSDRVQLSILLGAPVDMSMSPDFVAALQQFIGAQEPEDAPSASQSKYPKAGQLKGAARANAESQRVLGRAVI